MFLHTHACWGEKFKKIIVFFIVRQRDSQECLNSSVCMAALLHDPKQLIGLGVQLILRLCILRQGQYHSLQARIPLHNERVLRVLYFCSEVNVKIKIGRRRIQIKASFYHKFCLSSCFQLVVGNVC